MLKTHMWEGTEHMHIVLKYFFKQIEKKSGGTLRIMYYHCSTQLDGHQFVDALFDNLQKVLARKISVELLVLSCNIETKDDVGFFAKLMMLLCFNSKFSLRIVKNVNAYAIIENCFMYESDTVLMIRRIRGAKTAANAELYIDKTRIDFLLSYYKSLFADSQPFFEKLPLSSDKLQFLDKLFEFENSTTYSYAYFQVPVFLTMSDKVLEKVFSYNNISGLFKTKLHKVIKQIRDNENKISHFFMSMSGFEKMYDEDLIFLPFFSTLIGKKVYVPKNLMADIIDDWASHIIDTKEFLLTPQPLLKTPSGFGFYIKQYYFALMWLVDENQNKFFYTTSTYNTQLLYNLSMLEWQAQPEFLKNKQFIVDYLHNAAKILRK